MHHLDNNLNYTPLFLQIKNKKNSLFIKIAIIIAIIITVGFIFTQKYNNKTNIKTSQSILTKPIARYSVSPTSQLQSPILIEYKQNASWNSYSNEKENYNIQLPPEYKPEPGEQIGTSVTFKKCLSEICESGFSISKHEYTQSKPKLWLQDLLGTSLNETFNEELIIQNIKSLLLMDSASKTSYVIIPVEKNVYMFVFPFARDTEEKNINFIKELLATFSINK